jgi:organic hydroperoxide reductase OsmC/OhrA
MVTMTAEYRSLEGTGAAIGQAGDYVVVADRPAGKAGGTGLGFNGGQLLALALGGCFSNDLHYAAEQMGLAVAELNVRVSLSFDGEPLVASAAEMVVDCRLEDGGDPAALIERAKAQCTVANSLRAGLPVTIRQADAAQSAQRRAKRPSKA